jgi:hypothetical protein
VTYHVSTNATSRSTVAVSISWGCINDIAPLGMAERLKTMYGDMVAPTESGYDFTVEFDLDNPSFAVGTYFPYFLFLSEPPNLCC